MPTHGDNIIATIKMRTGDGWKLKLGASQIDGSRLMFRFGWEVDDPKSIYFGETAWLPVTDLPENAPSWIADGDLIDVLEMNNDPYSTFRESRRIPGPTQH